MTNLLKTLCAPIMMTSMACARADDTSDEAAALATLEGFFAAFSVEHYPNPAMGDWITDDFLIFEMGEVFTWRSFQAFLAGAGYADWISTDWKFSELRVSVSGQAAHISYVEGSSYTLIPRILRAGFEGATAGWRVFIWSSKMGVSRSRRQSIM